MKFLSSFISCALLCFLLSSCEFHCNIGSKNDDGKNKAVIINGVKLYNGIRLESHHVKVEKAYLSFEKGGRVPDDNFIGEYTPVKLLVFIDSGWIVENGMSRLGASEKVTAETGEIVLNEEDLFNKKESADLPEKDARIIGLTVFLRLAKNSQPHTFNVEFKIWDKIGDGYIEGDYELVSK
jgi:hypothetical protein